MPRRQVIQSAARRAQSGQLSLFGNRVGRASGAAKRPASSGRIASSRPVSSGRGRVPKQPASTGGKQGGFWSSDPNNLGSGRKAMRKYFPAGSVQKKAIFGETTSARNRRKIAGGIGAGALGVNALIGPRGTQSSGSSGLTPHSSGGRMGMY